MSPQCHVHPPCLGGLWQGKNCGHCPLSQYCRCLSDNICFIVQYNVEEGQSYILSGRLWQLKVCKCILSTSEVSVVCIWSNGELNSGMLPCRIVFPMNLPSPKSLETPKWGSGLKCLPPKIGFRFNYNDQSMWCAYPHIINLCNLVQPDKSLINLFQPITWLN